MRIIVVVLLSSVSFSIFSSLYDRAIFAAQKGNWDDAYGKLTTILVDSPDRADLLYDAGQVACNRKEFSQSKAYFLRAAECAQNTALKSRAYYNAGNIEVELKELKEALELYDKALAVDPNNEFVQHNREAVARMLEQQEQEKQQQQDQKQDKDQQDKDQQDKQDAEKNQDKQQGDGSDNDPQQDQSSDQSDKKQDQSDRNKQDDKKQGSDEKKSDEQSDADEGDNAQDGSEGDKRKEHRNKKNQQKKEKEKKERDNKNKPENESQDADGDNDKKQGNKHDKTPDVSQEQIDTNSVTPDEKQAQAKNAEQSGGEAEAQDKDVERAQAIEKQLNDPWLVNVLQKQEARDKAMNKQLMETKIRQHGGKNGQNCW